MGGRPREPAEVLALRGSFKRNPRRTRRDAAGNAPLSRHAPAHLPADCQTAWEQIVERLPLVAIYSADEFCVEIAATLLTHWRESRDLKVVRELRAYLVELGLSPKARTHLVAVPPAKPSDKEKPWAEFLDAKP